MAKIAIPVGLVVVAIVLYFLLRGDDEVTTAGTPSPTDTPAVTATAAPAATGTARPAAPTPSAVPPTATAAITPTATFTPTPGPVSKLSLSVSPATINCGNGGSTVATILLTDVNGGPAPTTRIRLMISPEVATIPEVTVTNGRADVRITPVGHAGPTFLTASVVPGTIANPPAPANAQFTCVFVNP